jgi:AraC-like DNA-binding protein
VHAPGLMSRHADRVLPVHELILVRSGVLPIAEGDRRFTVRRDEWVVLRAGRRHYGWDVLDPDTWFYWACFGSGPSGPDAVESVVLRGQRSGPAARPDRLRTLFEQLLADQEAALLMPPAARGYLQLLLAEILLPPPAPPRPEAAARLAGRAAAFISDRLTDPSLSTARIATALAFNPDYLGRVFRATFGESTTDRIHRLRIERARALLRSTDRPIGRIGADVGFGDDRYFRRIFKRQVGLTPGQFQRLRPPAERSGAHQRTDEDHASPDTRRYSSSGNQASE